MPFQVGVDIGENEQDPEVFKQCVILAEKLGFDVAWLGDHFLPWAHSSNRSSFVWSLIGSSLEASKKIKLGPYVTTPIGARYHPAIIAQAAATLDNMYPGRFLLGVGTGEAMNEVPFFGRWPNWKERMERLIEGVQLMRELWTKDEYFDFEGKYFPAHQIFLYTKPRTDLTVYFSGVGPKAARYAGEHGDALVTLSHANNLQRLREVIFPLFDEGARSAGKDPSKMEKVVSFNFTMKDPETYSKTERRYAGVIPKEGTNEPDPRKIEQLGASLPDDDLFKSVAFLSKWSDVVDLISQYREAGTTQIVLQTGADKKTIRTFAQKILPEFKTRR